MNLNERTFTAIGQYGFAQMVEISEPESGESSFLESECKTKCELAKDSNGNLVNKTAQEIRLCTTACKREQQETYCSNRCLGKGLTSGSDGYNQCVAGCKAELIDERKQTIDTALGGLSNILGSLNIFGNNKGTQQIPDYGTQQDSGRRQSGSTWLWVILGIMVVVGLGIVVYKSKNK